MPRSYDVVGSQEKAVAIIEVEEGERGRAKEIAQEIMGSNRSIKSVLRKLGERTGDFRNRQYELLAGDPDTEVTHKENGYIIRVDPRKAYFSVREGTERMRVARQVGPGETVIVMFAGVGPFAIAIAREQPAVERVVAIEINPDAVAYMRHNVRVNKLAHKVMAVLGDVRTECERWSGKCDRVVMPLPLGAGDFLDVAARCCRPGGIVHLYGWGNEADGDVFKAATDTMDGKMRSIGRGYEILAKRKVLPYAPGRYKVCVEFKVL